MAHKVQVRAARGFAAIAAMALACVLAVAAFVPAALAADGVTRSIGGLNYTLPSDWEQVEVPFEPSEVAEDVEIADLVAYSKYDGFFVAMHIPTGEGEFVTLEEFEEVAEMMSWEASGTMLEAFTFTAAEEQGSPALTIYTDDISFNDVVYALTVKIYGVDTGTTSDAVIMCSFLPASGQLNEDILGSLPVSDEPQRFELAGVSYEVPAGFALGLGNVLDFDFALGLSEDDGAVFGLAIPTVIDDGTVTVSDLQYVAEEALAEIEYQLIEQLGAGYTDLIQNMWMGAYSFLDFPTLGFEFNVNEEDLSVYVCATVNFTPAGAAVLSLVQFPDSTLGQYVLGSAEIVEDAEVPASAAGMLSTIAVGVEQVETVEEVEVVDPGFTIGGIEIEL